MELNEYTDTDMMMIALASALSRDLRAALGRRERVLFCVPGGTTPGPVFDLLAAVELDWSRVDIVLSDERCVPEDHPRSNAALVRRHLLQGPAASARLIPMWRPGMAPAAIAERLSTELAPLLPLDVALLGMGADMHTASLFPNAPRLDLALADDAPPVMAMEMSNLPEARLTLTAPVLRKAFALHLVVTGADKRAALERAEGADPLDAPVGALLDQAIVHWAE